MFLWNKLRKRPIFWQRNVKFSVYFAVKNPHFLSYKSPMINFWIFEFYTEMIGTIRLSRMSEQLLS